MAVLPERNGMRAIRRLGVWLLRAVLALLLLATVTAAGGWLLLRESGLAPAQVLDELEHHLQQRPEALQWLASPLALTREALNVPSPEERKAALGPPPAPPERWKAAPSGAVPSPGSRVLRVGPQETVKTLSEAARLAKDGDVVEVVAGDYLAPQAVWHQRRLSIRSVGGNARMLGQGKVAEGKAIWVIRDGQFSIEGIDFIGARATDRNGAGIRLERGQLTVRHCLFWDSDSGILTGGGAGQEAGLLHVESSEFGYLGFGDGLSHAIYVGEIGRFQISHSYLHHGKVGHLIKSRALVNHIRYNRITDEAAGRSSYQIDLPNGGLSVVLGNLIQKGPLAENGTLVSYGAEGLGRGSHRLYLVNNTLVNHQRHVGAFMRVAAGATSVVVLNNVLVGAGAFLGDAPLSEANNPKLRADAFVAPLEFDYRLKDGGSGARLNWLAPALPRIGDAALVPEAQYLHPRQLQPLPGPPQLPGAFQAEGTKR